MDITKILIHDWLIVNEHMVELKYIPLSWVLQIPSAIKDFIKSFPGVIRPETAFSVTLNKFSITISLVGETKPFGRALNNLFFQKGRDMAFGPKIIKNCKFDVTTQGVD